MTEQISHKKSLRVSRLNTDRQLLLNKYQQENNEENGVTIKDVNENVSDGDDNNVKNSASNDGPSLDKQEEVIVEEQEKEKESSSYTFKELIQIHNRLLGKEQETNNMIKSTIYDNYYDLIRVNDSLENILDPNSDINLMWDELKQNINT
ncbi:Vps51p PWA37_004405 [Arxiozyma heterogenica]|uniref:Uncharacterized protein n=1 Tax=Arxiozyma heterogenica TaxID=278026 RepID=A0AAN7WGJ5_9SACH|nr:hypothetical protein RI543_003419 [Kazachstania heterogenica]